MRFVILMVQWLISAVVTASVMPALLVALPAARDRRIGLSVMAGVMTVSFVLIALVWPRRRK
jgi:hypothetical protein